MYKLDFANFVVLDFLKTGIPSNKSQFLLFKLITFILNSVNFTQKMLLNIDKCEVGMQS